MAVFWVFHSVKYLLSYDVSEERSASNFRTTDSGSSDEEVTLTMETISSSETLEKTKHIARCKHPQHHPHLNQQITSYGSTRCGNTEDHNTGASLMFVDKSKCKVMCPLVQALRFCTGRTAHRGSRGIALPFLDHGTRRG